MHADSEEDEEDDDGEGIDFCIIIRMDVVQGEIIHESVIGFFH